MLGDSDVSTTTEETAELQETPAEDAAAGEQPEVSEPQEESVVLADTDETQNGGQAVLSDAQLAALRVDAVFELGHLQESLGFFRELAIGSRFEIKAESGALAEGIVLRVSGVRFGRVRIVEQHADRFILELVALEDA